MKKLQNKSFLNLFRLNFLNNFSYIFLICLPLLIYFGEKSFISFDEGYYALQGKWVLEYNNWVSSQWFDQIQFDRPPILPILIAISYKLFGINYFSAHLPILISSIFVLYFTYKIHALLIGDDFKWLSPLILITTSLWINFTHLATQDILLVALEIVGIYFLIKYSNDSKNYEIILSSMWVGLCFFLKTYMVIIPLISIAPFVFIYKKNLLTRKYFYFGFLLGFVPFIVWSILCFNLYGLDFINGINNKLISLSKSNTFSQPFFYYCWNLPISFLPWTPFCFYGLRLVKKHFSAKKYFILIIYPLLLIFLLSLFSTKIPYYTLQAFPFLAISTSYGLFYFSTNLNSNQKRFINKLIFTFLFLIISFLIYFSIKSELVIISQENSKFIFYFLAILLLILPTLIINILSRKKLNIFAFLLGPYLSILLLVQSGQFSNRSPDIKVAMNNLDKNLLNNNTQTFVITPIKITGDELSELIKITLYSKNNIKKIREISEIEFNQKIWVTKKKLEKSKNLETIYENKNISEWVLTKKVY